MFLPAKRFFRRCGPALSRFENPSILIRKSERKLFLFNDDQFIKQYEIALGFAPVGDKLREGDGKTPEGEFSVAVKNPRSKYFLSLGLNYPTVGHAERGLQFDLISRAEFDEISSAAKERLLPNQKTKLGGEIYIHGGGVLWDWTEGCVALENKDIEAIFPVVKSGTIVLIEP